MNCVVIGGSGFVGTALCQRLAEAGHAVTIVDVRTPAVLLSGTHYAPLPTDDQDALVDILQGADVCFHLASTTTPGTADRDVLYDLNSNVGFSIKLFDAAALANVGRVVFLSSGGTVYGPDAIVPSVESHALNPISTYGASKVAIENYLRVFRSKRGLDYKVARLANPYGPGQDINKAQGAIPIFMRRVLSGTPIEIWGDGEIVRDFIYIDDAIDALVAIAFNTGTSHVYNVGSGTGASINTVLDILRRISGLGVAVDYQPARGFDVQKSVIDCSLIRDDLGWQVATSLEQGMNRTWLALGGTGVH